MTEDADLTIVRQCLNGDIEAFGLLVERYQKVIFNLALRMTGNSEDAKDITQSAYIKAYENLHRFKPGHRFFSWIYRIAVNECVNFLNKRGRTPALSGNEVDTGGTPEENYCKTETAAAVDEAIRELSLDYRIVIVLRHFMDLSYCEMSDLIGIPQKTVKSRLFTARRQLATILSGRGVFSSD